MKLNKKHIESNSLYVYSKDFLTAIVNKQLPDANLINMLYGPQMNSVVTLTIKKFLNIYAADFGIARKHFESPLEIRSQRIKLENDRQFSELHSHITNFQLPSTNLMESFYGEYSISVQKHFEHCFDSRLIRKCGLSIAAHHNRVAAVVNKLKLDADDHYKYVAIGAMHDSIEDLLSFTLDKNGLKYGIIRYEEFINEIIPEKIRNEIRLLTNHYDLILEQLNNDFHYRDLAFTKRNLTKELENILKNNDNGLRYYHEEILRLIQDLKMETNLYRYIKWRCYQNYIQEMAEAAKKTNNYKTYIVKAVDLLDNCHGSDALDRGGKIKNILKLGIWAKQGYELSTTYSLVNNCVMEIYEEALHYSEYIILKDLFEEESKLDFLTVALSTILKLKSILFTNKPLSTEGLFFEQSKEKFE